METSKATREQIDAVKRELKKRPTVRCAVNPEREYARIVK